MLTMPFSMRRAALSLVVLCLLLAGPAARGQSSFEVLGQRLTDRLAATDWGEGKLLALVEHADLPIMLLSQNERTAFRPGRLVQLVTAACALDRLGPDFTFSTSLHLIGEVDENGNARDGLLIRSDGNPAISTIYLSDEEGGVWRLFDRWGRMFKQLGIKRVGGGVAYDLTAFDERLYGPSWPLDRAGSPELLAISPVSFNHTSIELSWKPAGREGVIPEVTGFPELGDLYQISNNVRVFETADEPAIELRRPPQTDLLVVNGELPSDTPYTQRAALGSPVEMFDAALRLRLKRRGWLIKRGVEFEGRPRHVTQVEALPPAASLRELDRVRSPRLPRMLGAMFEHDLALEAEALFKTLGRFDHGVGSFEAGARVIEAWLDRHRVPGGLRVLVDGSGRSSINRLSARQLIEVMRHGVSAPTGAALLGALPTGATEPDAGRLSLIAAEQPESQAVAGVAITPEGDRILFVLALEGSSLPASEQRDRLVRMAGDLVRPVIDPASVEE